MEHGQPITYTNRRAWMSQLPDSTRLSAMTIPGTYNTMALHGTGAACQYRSIADQYNMGVRFVDIHCRWFGNALPIHHGLYFQYAFFTDREDVVKPTVQFLREYPGETIMMLVKDEQWGTDKGDLSFSTLVRNSLRNAGASVLHKVPKTLGEARGYIILFHKDWPDNDYEIGTSLPSYFDVNDDCNEHDGANRWESAKKHLEKAMCSTSPILTYMSGFMNDADGKPDIYGMAEFLNSRLRQYVNDRRLGRIGVVLMVLAPDDIVGGLIKRNSLVMDLTHWGRDKMADFFQTTFSKAFSWMKMNEFWLRFHWSLFLRFQLTIFRHWLRLRLGADQGEPKNLNQWIQFSVYLLYATNLYKPITVLFALCNLCEMYPRNLSLSFKPSIQGRELSRGRLCRHWRHCSLT